jgi:flagellar protein FliS
MQPLARDYLYNEVMTATPQKLHLMLVEAALRFGNQARLHWQNGRNEEASEAIVRCQQIVAQLMAGLNPEHHRELVRQIAGVYLFVFRSFVAAHLNHDEARLNDALAVLEVEQETWRQICTKLDSRRTEDAGSEGLRLEA